MKHFSTTHTLSASAGLIAATASLSHAQLAINWYTIDGGGGTSTSGSLVLSGTIGQCDAGGVLSAGSITITGGYWAGGGGPSGCDTIDFNDDGVFPDSQDISDFLSVFGGGSCSNDPNCHDIDFNNDGVFPDSGDIEAFLTVFGGGSC